MDGIRTALTRIVHELFGVKVTPELTVTDEQFGDYATNVAMQLAGQLGRNPRQIAEELKPKLSSALGDQIAEVTIAGPGFINIRLSDPAIIENALTATTIPKIEKGKLIIVEFGDPNPFKEMHLGHLYTAVVGDAICHLLETTGAKVQRVSYHGDVGLHVAKAIWGMQQACLESGQSLNENSIATILNNNLGFYYARGAKAYEEDPQSAEEIKTINKQVYEHIYDGLNNDIGQLYDWGKARSFGFFDEIFKELGIKYDKRYLESASSKKGLEFVHQNTGKVFKESEGATIYEGERVGLHTRVFINSRGLPTYEAKDLGLAELKATDYPDAAQSIIITAHEQREYFKVMLAALHEIDPKLAEKTTHLAHGFLSLTTGKMSSRTGNVYAAANLIENVGDEVKRQYPDAKPENKTYLAAVKYTLLKNRIGSDIVFDVQESVSLEGNSGPYLQYAHARARSILAKASGQPAAMTDLEKDERSLARAIARYPQVVQKAVEDLMPHHICTYLYELAQTFNRFYEHNRVIDDPREAQRLQLVTLYADVLRDGLGLLGISAPNKM